MSVSKDILHGLQEFKDALESEDPVSEKLTVRKVKLNLKPVKYTPKKVKAARELLGVSQAVFAEFIGVSPKTVQSWEQGENPVSGAAARLMDEITCNPEYWRKRVFELAKAITA